MTALGIAIIGGGVLLIVSGVKDVDPRSVVLALLTGEPLPQRGDTYTSPGTAAPRTAPGGGLNNGAPTGRVGGTVGGD